MPTTDLKIRVEGCDCTLASYVVCDCRLQYLNGRGITFSSDDLPFQDNRSPEATGDVPYDDGQE